MSGPDGLVTLRVYRPYEFATPSRPCAEATTPVALDATPADVAAQLAALPQFDIVTGPTALPAFGRVTQYLELEADKLVCPPAEGDQYNLADVYGEAGMAPNADSDVDPGNQVRIRFWVLELGGDPIVVEARQERAPTDGMLAQLDQVRRSLTFGERG